MAYLAKPEEKSILRQLYKAVINVKNVSTKNFYNEVASIYSWRQVAERTERVYDYAMERPVPNMLSRIKSSIAWGPVVGVWAIFYTIMEALILWLTELVFPAQDIDIVRNFNSEKYNYSLK
jgi:phosphatidylinositol glycan class A protein